MGGIVLEKGCAFRVWAPNADAVSIVGTFNDWKIGAHPLQKEDGGTWFGIVDHAREGDAYRYIIHAGGQELSRPDPHARCMDSSVGNSFLWKPKRDLAGTAFEPPTMDQLAVYEMHIGSFHVRAGEAHGTFDSAIEKLPYLRDLGVNAVEVMPVAEFAGDFSWGYNPAHPWSVESAYGGPEGFLRFIKATHEHGIAVILDVVYNHFGPSDLGLWQFDGWSENGKGGIYFYNDWRAATPWGDTRPDYGRGEVRSYIRDNALMWFHEYGVDGLRFDMTVFIRTFKGSPGADSDDLKEGWGLLQWINDEVHKEFPKAITIAEDLQNSEWLVKGTGAGGGGFNTQWDAAFVHPIRAVMIAPDDAHRDLNAVCGALSCRYDGDAFKRVVYSESHDEVANGKARLPSEIQPEDADSMPARKRSTLAAALALTAPGVPMLFQGQEFLEDEWFRDSVPLQWEKLDAYPGIHSLYRDLVHLRLNRAGHTAGLCGQHLDIHHVDHERKIISYRRWREGGPGDETLIIVNLSHAPVTDYRIGVSSPGVWKVRFNSDGHAYSSDFGNHPAFDMEAREEPHSGQPYSIQTGVGAYAMVICSQDRES
jgi:1,4-alpha-glucan branching enzyme